MCFLMLITVTNKSKIPQVVRTALELAYYNKHTAQHYDAHVVWSNMLLAADYHQHPHFGRKINGNKAQICCGSVLGTMVNLGVQYDLDAGTIQILNMDVSAFGEPASTQDIAHFLAALKHHKVDYCLQTLDYEVV